MYTCHEISLEEHTQWFERVCADNQHHLLIFEDEGVPLGFVNLRQIDPGGIARWGFYAAPDAPKGTGRQLGRAALQHAFETLKLYKLNSQVLIYNERSIRFHLNQGFQQEGILRQQHFDGQHYHDVVCFGLLACEWRPKD